MHLIVSSIIRRRRRKSALHVGTVIVVVLLLVCFWSDPDELIWRGVYGIDESEYLYHTEEAKGIIIDYEPPVSSQQQDGNNKENKKIVENKPDFLYGPNQGPRVVEFYAPWCPHCQHFRTHYIKFAQQVQDIMKEYRVEGPSIQFYAVSCTVHKALCKAQNIRGYPKIQLFPANTIQNATKEVMYWKLHVFDVLDALQIHVKHLPVQSSVYETLSLDDWNSKNKNNKLSIRDQRTKQQVFDDAYKSFHFNLQNGIYLETAIDGSLKNQTQAILKQWLELVKKTVPVVWELHSLVNELIRQFPLIIQKEENLISILDKFPPPSDKWSMSCTKNVEGMGYTCGLWELFHIVSVGLVEYNLMISTNDDTVLSELSLRTTDAAETIRNFVEYFFACDVCRYNFLQAYDNCAHDRCHRLSDRQMDTAQWIQFPIWLFETHNAVNVRLYEEQMTKDKKNNQNGIISHRDKVLVQWPNQKLCPACWLHGNNNDGWDDDAVYKYLRTEYWSEDLISADYRAEVTRKKPFVDEDEEEENILTASTIIQVIEWFVVICLIATWYYKRSKHIQSGLHKKKDLEC